MWFQTLVSPPQHCFREGGGVRAEEEAGSEIPRLQTRLGSTSASPPQASSSQTHDHPPLETQPFSPSLHASTSGLGSLETVWEALGAQAVESSVAGRVAPAAGEVEAVETPLSPASQAPHLSPSRINKLKGLPPGEGGGGSVGARE